MACAPIRPRSRLLLLVVALLFFRVLLLNISLLLRHASFGSRERSTPQPSYDELPPQIRDWEVAGWEPAGAVYREKMYKPEPAGPSGFPVPDPFPLLSENPPPAPGILRAPKVNRPPQQHCPEQTPLFVGFTRNWPLLLQCVVSYIAAGWPAEDIIVVENTGVMHANRDGKLTLQNPFYLNHTQLSMLGVNVITTPTLLTFSQLQNFYLWTALTNNHPYFFWTHQDVLVFSFEKDNNKKSPSPSPTTDRSTTTTGSSGTARPSSLYANALSTLRHLTTNPAHVRNVKPWAHHFFAYDHLTLVNRDVVLDVLGGWDAHIPFYASDCDAYLRARWAGLAQTESEIGIVLDVGSVMADLGALLRVPGCVGRLLEADGRGNEGVEGWGPEGEGETYVESWERLVGLGEKMQEEKYVGGGNGLRNQWQAEQRGGKGEPFYRDADGFEIGVQMMIETGRNVFAEKWGHRGCDVGRMGVVPEDAWRLERDWEEDEEDTGSW
ncbi:hypothetical protein F5144DRAFT_581240 [Chaetomium tenue]|uniref:Uncharacterized protein n=1 Tax=Chaetomium tenue TaxID=1854479 RepID=A0ACB7NYM0_9PEZI|nr:hypothetical protein F5144DRAFT_581240 [Chaetomium globosum]